MARKRQTWSLADALELFCEVGEIDEFRQLHERWNYGSVFVCVGGPPTSDDLERGRYWDIRTRLETKLLDALRSGAFKAERVDPERGPVAIRSRVWDVLDPDFFESTGVAAGRRFVGIRVWPVDRSSSFSVAKEQQLQAWFRDFVREGHRPDSKEQLFQEAAGRFPGLTKRAFDRAWGVKAPPGWKHPGQRPSHSESDHLARPGGAAGVVPRARRKDSKPRTAKRSVQGSRSPSRRRRR